MMCYSVYIIRHCDICHFGTFGNKFFNIIGILQMTLEHERMNIKYEYVKMEFLKVLYVINIFKKTRFFNFFLL